MDNNQLNLIEMIDYIEQSGLDYQEWFAVAVSYTHMTLPTPTYV